MDPFEPIRLINAYHVGLLHPGQLQFLPARKLLEQNLVENRLDLKLHTILRPPGKEIRE